ncbi:MAG: TolC family protein [Tannerellaceae bacterium]|jgi:outer membrane protein TolC|nr:TolC family protein [Tannerellaceae bacterium]
MKRSIIRYSGILAFLTLFAGFPLRAAEEDSLAVYLAVAARENPSVKAAYLDYEAACQKLPQAGAYADPTFEAGIFPEPMEFAAGRQVAQFRLMQMFPWFGTRKAARTEAQHMANMAFEQFREARDNVFMEVYTQWYALCSLRRKIINNKENRQWLEQLEQLALRKFSSGTNSPEKGYASGGGNASPATAPTASSGGMDMGGSAGTASTATMPPSSGSSGGMRMAAGGMGGASGGMSEVLRIQLEIMESESNMESLQAEIAAGKARFNTLLNRPAESEVVMPDEWQQLPFRPDVESILHEVAGRNPMLGMLREEALAYEAKAEMDRKMGYPMFGVGIQYMLMSPLKTDNLLPEEAMGGGDGMTMMNGKDMVMPMASISIPLYRNKYKAARKESQLRREASETKRADTFNKLQAALYQSVYLLEDADRKAGLYRRQADLARTAGDLAMQEFVSGKSDLGSVIQVQRQLLDYRLKEAEAIANYNTLVAAIQKMMSFLTIE